MSMEGSRSSSRGVRDYQGRSMELETWERADSQSGSRSLPGFIHHTNPESVHGNSRAQSLAGTIAQQPRQIHIQQQSRSRHSPIPSDYESAIDEEDEEEEEEEYEEDYYDYDVRVPPRPNKAQPHGDVVMDMPLTEAEEVKQRVRSSIVFSCFVCLCCNIFCGAAAFFVALSSRDAKPKEARRLGNIALSLNVFGILMSWIMMSIIIGLWWYGLIYIPFAPWRIQHYYADNRETLIEANSFYGGG